MSGHNPCDPALALVVRSCLLRLLASLFGYPKSGALRIARENLKQCVAHCGALGETARGCVERLDRSFGSMSDEEYQSEYLRVFTHVFSPDCNPCETSYVAKHIFQVSQRMAQISGFYQAFGLEASGERPDHVSVELEFLAFLCYREAFEGADGSEDKAALMRDAQRRFLTSHTGEWALAFAALVRARSAGGVLASVADLLEAALSETASGVGAEIKDFSGLSASGRSPNGVQKSQRAEAGAHA